MRKVSKKRSTTETSVEIELILDGSGRYDCKTGVGFFDHMLEQLARHGRLDLKVRAQGDLHIDSHHTVEDTGLLLGEALLDALGDKRGITRYGACSLPMDDALVCTSLDLSGRPYLVWNVNIPAERIGNFETQLVREFFQAVCSTGRLTLNMESRSGFNAHHIVEAAFKSFGRALAQAIAILPGEQDLIPSTKGIL